jgi:hypothetical protein
MPKHINKFLAMLLLLGAIGGFGLSTRRSFQVQSTTKYGTPIGPLRTVAVSQGDRIFYISFGLVCFIGSAYFIARSR